MHYILQARKIFFSLKFQFIQGYLNGKWIPSVKPLFAKVQTLSVMASYKNHWIMLKENPQAKSAYNLFFLTNALGFVVQDWQSA